MAVELKVPAVGESITEVQIGQWLRGEGQSAAKDEALVEIETDKATVELPAPIAGRVTKVLKQAGETATVGEVVGYMEADGAKAAKPQAEARAKEPPEKEQAKPEVKPPVAGKEPQREEASAGEKQAQIPEPKVELMSSAARLHEGPSEQTVAPRKEARTAPPTFKPPTKAERPAVIEPGVSFIGEREEEVTPMSPIRRRIAQRLVEAQQTAALLTTFNEIDMSEVIALREAHRDLFQQRYEVKLGFLSFFVKAVVDSLKLVPQVNAEIRGNNIIYRNYYDIGIAVGGGKGLVVPVLRNAELLSFAEIELVIADFGRRARENKLTVNELQGGTFTISNGGVYGSLLSTPIVNPPQSGILGLHAIQERPVARNGQVVIRPMMYVALTYDHRLIEGREAVTFLKRIKEVIEEPMRMMIEV
jgi:2-oxoglutarate dehydrogenase E2 component (dihydrolipoamide succinyltransferase)